MSDTSPRDGGSSPRCPRAPGRLRRSVSGVLLCSVALMLAGMVSGGLAERASGMQSGMQQAGTTPGDALRILAVDTSSFPEVTASVTLPLAAGQQPDASDNLSVSSAGVAVPATVDRLPADRQPVAILLDTADGTPQATLAAQQGAAADLVRQLDPATPVLVASSTGGLVAGPGLSRQGSLGAIVQLRTGGRRDWPKAMAATLDALGKASRPTVIVVSAGPSSKADKVPAGLSADLAAHPLKAQWLSLRDDAGPLGVLRQVQPVTRATTAGLPGRLDAIAAQHATQYRLSFRVDPRATAAAITLVTQAGAWTAETPLPFPSPALAPQSTVRADAQPSSPTKHSASATERTTNFLTRNWKFLVAGVAAALFLGMSFSVVSVSKTPPPRHRSRGTGLEPPNDLAPSALPGEKAGQRSA